MMHGQKNIKSCDGRAGFCNLILDLKPVECVGIWWGRGLLGIYL